MITDFDKRGGPGPRGGGQNFNGGGNDFHPNLQNRFNQPTNLMQMRIPPPNAFNQRGGPGGGPPMFMRGGLGGGRQQGPGKYIQTTINFKVLLAKLCMATNLRQFSWNCTLNDKAVV